MRGTRWLLLAAILAILGGTGFIYLAQKRVRAKNPTPKPPEIANGLSATAEDWEWSRTDAGKAVVKIRAHQLRQMEDANSIELEGVTLNLFQKDGQHADLVKSAKAMFDKAKGTLTSEGDVEIYLSVPTGAEPTDNLTRIRSAGISFDSKTGKAVTDRATSFRFEGGEGTCVGAAYDPTTRELHLTKQVVMNLRGKAPGAKTMKIETDELTYKEAESVIWLTPKARLTREHSILDAGPSVVNLKEGKIQTIAAHDGHGVDTYPKRKLDYSAGMMVVNYNAEGEIEKVLGMDKPRLVSEAEGSSTAMNATQVDLDFVEKDGESVLTHALGNGNAVVENRQLPDPAKRQKTPETRILRSALLDLYMRPEGKELDKVVTRTPGTLEFLPNEPEQHRRLLNGDKMTIVYGPKNSVQSFATTQAATQTFPNQLEIARAQKAKSPLLHELPLVKIRGDIEPRFGESLKRLFALIRIRPRIFHEATNQAEALELVSQDGVAALTMRPAQHPQSERIVFRKFADEILIADTGLAYFGEPISPILKSVRTFLSNTFQPLAGVSQRDGQMALF